MRLTKFLEKKSAFSNHVEVSKDPLLSIKFLPQIDIQPNPRKILSYSNPCIISIAPISRNLSNCKIMPSEIVPGIVNEDEDLFFSYINGGTFETTFVCNFCYNDNFNSTQSIRRHIRNAHRTQMEQNLQFQQQQPYQPTFRNLIQPIIPISSLMFISLLLVKGFPSFIS